MANIFDIDLIRSVRDIESATALLHEQIAFDEQIEDALLFSKEAHAHQLRKSGEPYIVHPILVSALVASITGDRAMVIAALLHDVVEDTEHGIEVVEENGVITLEGQVPSHEVKESAESVIEMVFGIKSIVNRLHIQVENLDEPLKEEAISE